MFMNPMGCARVCLCVCVPCTQYLFRVSGAFFNCYVMGCVVRDGRCYRSDFVCDLMRSLCVQLISCYLGLIRSKLDFCLSQFFRGLFSSGLALTPRIHSFAMNTYPALVSRHLHKPHVHEHEKRLALFARPKVKNVVRFIDGRALAKCCALAFTVLWAWTRSRCYLCATLYTCLLFHVTGAVGRRTRCWRCFAPRIAVPFGLDAFKSLVADLFSPLSLKSKLFICPCTFRCSAPVCWWGSSCVPTNASNFWRKSIWVGKETENGRHTEEKNNLFN